MFSEIKNKQQVKDCINTAEMQLCNTEHSVTSHGKKIDRSLNCQTLTESQTNIVDKKVYQHSLEESD
jgi:hypothetical protein